MIWIILCVIAIVFYKFFRDFNKDKEDLHVGLEKKFKIILDKLNSIAFRGDGVINFINQRTLSLYKQSSNQIIFFEYSTGILTITWKYKYFQKEVVHKREYRQVRNLSIFEQQNIADSFITEMLKIIENHQVSVLGSVQSEDELINRIRSSISKFQ